MPFDKNIDEGHAEGEEKLHFYYNRAERLETAPQSVRDLYSGKFKMNKGFKVLVSNKANRFLLVTLAICIVFVLFTTVLSSADKGRLCGVPIRLTAFAYDEEIYVSLKMDASSKKADFSKEVPVDMIVTCFDVDGQPSVPQKVSEIYKGKELFLRTKFSDYDILTIKVNVTALDEVQTLSSSVQRR